MVEGICMARAFIFLPNLSKSVCVYFLRRKVAPFASGRSLSSSSMSALVNQFRDERAKAGKSILEFNFNETRVRTLSAGTQQVRKPSNGILYWMSRDMRVQDNWAFLFAQKLALKSEVPLHICFCLQPRFLEATIRHYDFLLRGLQEVAAECVALNISFHLLLGESKERVPEFVESHNFGALVTDFAPLRVPMSWVDSVKLALSPKVPFFQVDAHNIVPLWVTSDKLEYAAYTIRAKVNGKLGTYLTQFPPVIRHKFSSTVKAPEVNWEAAYESLEVDQTVKPVEWCKPGYLASVEVMQGFLAKRLRLYEPKRNDPTSDALSDLSPWFHFGQLSVQRVILEVNKYKSQHQQSVEKYNEETIVRRELADNFCYYNENYDNFQGIDAWATKTLKDHLKDKRRYLYSLQQFEEARTHDELWNSAQLQMVHEGKMHQYIRMYWAKKILEWTKTPEEALKIAIYLNDRYSIDGRDPNGYVGCQWSICGVHDRPFQERDIFGKIRYMSYEATKKKFDIFAYINRYSGNKNLRKK